MDKNIKIRNAKCYIKQMVRKVTRLREIKALLDQIERDKTVSNMKQSKLRLNILRLKKCIFLMVDKLLQQAH